MHSKGSANKTREISQPEQERHRQLACKEARAFERRVASLLATKWDRRYSKMVSFVRTRMSIALVRSNTLLLRGARRHGRSQRPVIEDEVALNGMDGMRES